MLPDDGRAGDGGGLRPKYGIRKPARDGAGFKQAVELLFGKIPLGADDQENAAAPPDTVRREEGRNGAALIPE